MPFDAVGLCVPPARADEAAQLLMASGASGTWQALPPGVEARYTQPWDTSPASAPEWVEVRAFFPPGSRRHLHHRLRAWLGSDDLRWWVEEDRDWEAESRAGFPRLVLSDELAVAPPWEARDGDVVIEPGRGYGTGQHACTHLALTALLAVREPGEPVLDAGCGAGVLALCAARLGHPATGFDTDPAAAEAARANARRSGLEVDWHVQPLDGWSRSAPLVLANLYAEVLVSHAGALAALTERCLVTSGILADKEAQVRHALAGPLLPTRRWEQEGWVCLAWERA